MTIFVGLLRAVNVAGRKTFKNADLENAADELGIAGARALLASGNLVFTSDKPPAAVKTALERGLSARLGFAAKVVVRTSGELRSVVAENPFADLPGNAVQVFFLDDPLPADFLDTVRGKHDERIVMRTREVYVAYGERGIGRSRLRIPAAEAGTARNVNTVTKLAELSREMS